VYVPLFPTHGVCSRNLDLEKDETNSFWMTALRDKLHEKIESVGRGLAIQGELIGPKIQGNPYGLTRYEFKAFDVFDITARKYLSPEERHALIESLEIDHVPVLDKARRIALEPTYTEEALGDGVDGVDGVDGGAATTKGLIKEAEGASLLGVKPIREGLVFKDVAGPAYKGTYKSFKVISNAFLLKQK
jgi:hypothetical protein